DVPLFGRVTRPSTTDDGLYVAWLRFGEQRVMAIFAALVGFCLSDPRLRNRQLVKRVGALLQSPYTLLQRAHDLRRLRAQSQDLQPPFSVICLSVLAESHHSFVGPAHNTPCFAPGVIPH